jgi:hypothetical protein
MDTRTELLEVFGPIIRPCCGPIYFATSLESAVETDEANGSFGLMDTGSKKVLVTCDHVVQDFKALNAKKKAWLGVCLEEGRPVVLDLGLLIDRDAELDLAVFDMEPLLQFCRGREFYDLRLNPPPLVKPGDGLVFHGYPGERRKGKSTGLEFGRFTFAVTASDVTSHRILADVSNVTRQTVGGTPVADPYGGISGAPAFLRRAGDKPSLVAVVTSVAPGGMNLMRFTVASCIQTDGRISKR